jgi:hypothetical protein
MAKDDSAAPPRDVVFVHSPTVEGEGFRVVRAREDRVEVGEIRPMKEGHPITGEVVRLKPRKDEERLFDVEVLLEKPASAAAETSRTGPAQVATDAYRAGWNAIFGTTTTELLN